MKIGIFQRYFDIIARQLFVLYFRRLFWPGTWLYQPCGSSRIQFRRVRATTPLLACESKLANIAFSKQLEAVVANHCTLGYRYDFSLVR